MEETNLDKLSALAHDGRLSVFRLLMRRYPDAVSAGDLAAALDLKPSTLSVYLSALRRAGLIGQDRHGTSLLYSADISGAGDLVSFLFNDCCRGRADMCLPSVFPLSQRRPDMAQDKFNVLFICTGNSARSIFAEALLRDEAGARFNAFSAGTKPYSELNPFAVEMLQSKGHDVSPLRAKNVAEFTGPDAPRLDFVFTVCDQAANEECPAWDGQPISAHWGMPDPVKVDGSDAQKSLAFQDAYRALRNRIVTFASLPIETLDRVSLQNEVDEIGKETITR